MDFSEELVEPHDLTVDYILTPTRVIKTDCLLPKPEGIIWSKVESPLSTKSVILCLATRGQSAPSKAQ